MSMYKVLILDHIFHLISISIELHGSESGVYWCITSSFTSAHMGWSVGDHIYFKNEENEVQKSSCLDVLTPQWLIFSTIETVAYHPPV